jgi:dTDP-glucose 4,6-dehydratase
MKTLLVTGGAGFIGGNFVRMLLEEKTFTVVNLDLLTYAGNLATLDGLMHDDRHVFVKGDIADQALVRDLFKQHRPDAVINFAAESHVDRSIDGPMDFIMTNVVGTSNLLQCAREFWNELDDAGKRDFRFLHVSTDEVYGSLGDTGFFTEETPYAPNSPYSASKAASDHLVRAWFHTYGMPVLTTNCSNNYGPYQYPEKLIPLMTLNALDGKPLPIYGDGSNVRDWLYVVDHCQAIWRVLEAGTPGEVYNVGGNCERTNLQIVDTLCSIMDEFFPDSPSVPHDKLKVFVDDRPGHDQRYAIDASKLKRELDWEPQATFEAGLRNTIRWYLDNLDWCAAVTQGKYGRERLGTAGS